MSGTEILMKGKCNLGLIFPLIGALLLLLIFSWSTSPLYCTYGCDSPFFQIIGLGILQGKVPYVDLFDHKGPVLFFIEALGYSFGLGRLGLWLLQLVFMTCTLALTFKVARLLSASDRQAYTATALTLIPMVDFIVEGNQCEEWELPFICGALLISCGHVLSGDGRMAWWKHFLMGLLFSIVFYIRPNDGVMWIGGLYFGLFLINIVDRRFSEAFKGAGLFLSAFVVVSLPVFGYFLARGAVGDFLYGMIIHNIKYTSDALFTWGGIWMIAIPVLIVSITMAATRDRRKLWYLFIPVLVLVLLLIGKRDYYHYLLPFSPYVAICFTLMLERKWKPYLIIICLLFAGFSYMQCVVVGKCFAERGRMEAFYEQSDALLENVPEEERNQIWNYNLTTYCNDTRPQMESLMGIFLHKGLTPGNCVFAAYDVPTHGPEKSLPYNDPKWLVMQPEDSYNVDFDYIVEHFDLVAATPSEPLCEVRLYRRKEQF